MPPPNPKPFDQAFKTLVDADARGFLDAVGVLPADADADVEALPQEVAVSAVAMDAGFVIRRRSGGDSRVVVFEAMSRFGRESLERVVWYNTGLAQKYRLPIDTYMVPLVRRACPDRIPGDSDAVFGGLRITVSLHWIRPWEIDAGVLLAKGNPEFDAWTVLFRWSDEQQREVLLRLKDAPEQAARFRILGGLRYRGNEAAFWRGFVERMNEMLTKESFRESLAVQEWLAEGRMEGLQKGLQEGRLEGQTEGQLAVIEVILNSRFPGLSAPAGIQDPAILTRLAADLLAAPDEQAARVVLARYRSN